MTSLPHFPQSNGLVEKIIGTTKSTMKKANASGQVVDMAILLLRTTPIDSQMPSPAELLYARMIQGNLPMKIPNVHHDRGRIQQTL